MTRVVDAHGVVQVAYTRDALGRMSLFLVQSLKEGRVPADEELERAAWG